MKDFPLRLVFVVINLITAGVTGWSVILFDGPQWAAVAVFMVVFQVLLTEDRITRRLDQR